ncbi:MAG: YbjN domain-containing protein [Candidatus Fermentibacteraceae bacterium]|nr:YbjN domain-containing protein [Candidatus Fermentibacteraceae bacterium]MBN2607850.1 YbjN domain-containing protein [Candidatus Fermentibacteraceae bacterium]
MKHAMPLLLVLASISLAEISGDTVAGYLDQIGQDLVYERSGNEFVLIAETADSVQVPYMYILVDPEMEGCLLVALTPALLPESGPQRTADLEILAQLNWDYTWVKFAADPETGEVSAMYTFSTENGMGYEAFAVMVNLLLGTVEENWETLSSF